MEIFSIKNIIGSDLADIEKKVQVYGWIRTTRIYKDICFITLNDGSTITNLQIVVESILTDLAFSDLTTGTSVCVVGLLKKSCGAGQFVELFATKITILGHAALNYPLQPKAHSMEFLRSIPHLRLRTNTFGAIMRIRSEAARLIHDFFYKKQFYNFHSPIITTIDGEGAGEMFVVDTKNADERSVDFFKEKAFLTVTGQLEAETAALALAKVYTFGPTFRAENSNTTRHLAEFWMVEPEVAFADLNDIITLGIDLLQYVILNVCTNCQADIEFLEKKDKNNSKEKLTLRLTNIIESKFELITYSEAIDILLSQITRDAKFFDYTILQWGDDIRTEHEKFLTAQYFKKPVVITSYPKELKAFYMKQNDDKKTVAAMDILVAEIGEIIGGSQREDDYEKLKIAMDTKNIDTDKMNWYLDTRKFGSVVHSGFGLGFERLIMLLTGVENIRDVIPFPRTPGQASNCFYKTN